MYLYEYSQIVLHHVTIVLSLTFIVFHILDWYNPQMAFSSNPISSLLLLVLCVSAIVQSVVSRLDK